MPNTAETPTVEPLTAEEARAAATRMASWPKGHYGWFSNSLRGFTDSDLDGALAENPGLVRYG